MASVTLVRNKGSELTTTEADNNFTNLNTDKIEIATPATATADTMTLAYEPTVTAYEDRKVYVARVGSSNTGAATLNIDSVGAADVTLEDGSALEADHLLANQVHLFQYDSTSGDFYLLNPAEDRGEAAAPNHFSPATLTYLYNGLNAPTTTDISSESASTWVTLGPSSSGNGTVPGNATHTWAAMDDIPRGAVVLILAAEFTITHSSNDIDGQISFRGRGNSDSNANPDGQIQLSSVTGSPRVWIPKIEAALDPDTLQTEFNYVINTGTLVTLNLFYRGFRA